MEGLLILLHWDHELWGNPNPLAKEAEADEEEESRTVVGGTRSFTPPASACEIFR